MKVRLRFWLYPLLGLCALLLLHSHIHFIFQSNFCAIFLMHHCPCSPFCLQTVLRSHSVGCTLFSLLISGSHCHSDLVIPAFWTFHSLGFDLYFPGFPMSCFVSAGFHGLLLSKSQFCLIFIGGSVVHCIWFISCTWLPPPVLFPSSYIYFVFFIYKVLYSANMNLVGIRALCMSIIEHLT